LDVEVEGRIDSIEIELAHLLQWVKLEVSRIVYNEQLRHKAAPKDMK
jgi:hypothetical protein